MLSGALVLMLMADASAPTVRELRPWGLALAPGLVAWDVGGEFGADGVLMPFGATIARQLGARWAVALSWANFPAEHTPINHLHLGARRYLAGGGLSPYLAADLGMEWNPTDYEMRRSPFFTAGGGLEWALSGGLLLAADLYLGPLWANVGTGTRDWQLLARVRLLVGYRF
jgi:hypothetical protein